LDDPDKQHHQGDDQQDMDESTHRVTADEAEQPKDNKNQSDRV
jgi:hypothetical protein